MGNEIPEDIPDTLLGEFSIGNNTTTTASMETVMGTELHSEMGYWQPGRGWQTSRNYPIAGEYRAIALDLQGISQQQAQVLQADLEATQTKLTNEDFTNLTKQQLVGDLRYSTILGYRAPSYGLFKTSLTPEYWYGIPRNVKADGLGMDVDRFSNLRVDKANNQENWLAFNRAQGARMSAMEHLVPEQMFSTEEASEKPQYRPATASAVVRDQDGEYGVSIRHRLTPLANFVREIIFRIASFFGNFSDVTKILWERTLL